MLKIQKREEADLGEHFTSRLFTERTVFFDIETTGLDPARSDLYLIGLAARSGGGVLMEQYFAERPSDVPELLAAFSGRLSGFDRVVTFNGERFDIPFLQEKYRANGLADPFDGLVIDDGEAIGCMGAPDNGKSPGGSEPIGEMDAPGDGKSPGSEPIGEMDAPGDGGSEPPDGGKPTGSGNPLHSTDLCRILKTIRPFIGIPNAQQRTAERFLGIKREDENTGGELISVYKEYLRHPSQKSLGLLLLHNHDDVLCMPRLCPLLSYLSLLDGGFKAESLRAATYSAADGGSGNRELFLSLALDYPVPAAFLHRDGGFYLRASGGRATLRVPVFDGELFHFFENPRDYYYLPEEDAAVHKSAASGVDRSRRVQATRENCYVRKKSLFLPQYGELFAPAFREGAGGAASYFELTGDFARSREMQTRYAAHVIAHMGRT